MPATLPSEFTTQTDRLAARATQAAKAAGLPGILRRGWCLPVGAGDDPGLPGTLVVPRPECNSLYATALTTGSDDVTYGRLGSLVALKSAIDYLGGFERATLAEFAGRGRVLRWTAARRAGHGDVTYGVYASVRRDLEYVLASAEG